MVVLSSVEPPAEEGVQHKQINTKAFIGQRDLGTGTLYIAENRVSWRSENGQGFSLDYPSVTLHAISRDLSSFPHECLYLMVEGAFEDVSEDSRMNGDDNTGSGGDNGDDADSESNVTEIRFVPAEKTTLDTMFASMSDCQALHPDEYDSNSGEEYEEDVGGGEFYDGTEEEIHLTAQGQATLQRLENMLQGSGDGGGAVPTNVSQNNGNTEPTEEMDMEMGQFDDATE